VTLGSSGTNAGPVPVRIGVSACLLGAEVRFDGGHKRNELLVDVLGWFVEWVPLCPEFELGLGVSRETLSLVRKSGRVRLIGNQSGTDHTVPMRSYAARRAAALAHEGLSGYVLKKGSPSCGMERIEVYGRGGRASRNGRGLFADALMRRFPNLPVEEEERLGDPRIAENFIERVFAYRRLRALFSGRWTPSALVAFHSAHRLQLLAHSPREYRELERIVRPAGQFARQEVRARYESAFMRALSKSATPARHVNVLRHALGCLHGRLDDGCRRELLGLIGDYRAGLVPLTAPITLIRCYALLFDMPDLKNQVYLNPHPDELMLRNRIRETAGTLPMAKKLA
jgi:uncharacterized protein YbgA (DUF1722 family)/uncharacterized protein YbbK (DUF523 family)